MWKTAKLRSSSARSWLVLAAALVLISGCQNLGRVPVESVDGQRMGASASSYVVRKGDTLYSIAFRYGLDYKSVADVNGIGPPYTIFVGQRLKLKGTAKRVAKDSGPAPKAAGSTQPRVSKPVRLPPSQQETRVAITTPNVRDEDIVWRWPYDGKVVARFSPDGKKVNKGIDIEGRPGDPVKAAAEGVVVYAGGGLRGYGKLVIVKHSDRYLSAYGHNESILVKEGDKVSQGQILARLGAETGALHFEIRRNGKPADPLRYLPQRPG